jgi:hypothetical protein
MYQKAKFGTEIGTTWYKPVHTSWYRYTGFQISMTESYHRDDVQGHAYASTTSISPSPQTSESRRQRQRVLSVVVLSLSGKKTIITVALTLPSFLIEKGDMVS